ncbi:hypothetical protein WJX77_000468 [Trebouxia sp. C0004]
MASSGVGQHGNHNDGSKPTLLTAKELPVEDAGVHHVGQCRLITVQHFDCGLIWADYPSNAVLAHPKNARKRNKKGPESIALESEESTGLGEAYDKEEDSCVRANDHQHQLAIAELHQDDSADDQCMQFNGVHLLAVQAQESACEWQQAYDDAYGCFYYYRERTQETQWEQPSDGFLPAPAEWLAYAQQQQQQQQGSSIHEEARLLDDPCEPPLQPDMMTDDLNSDDLDIASSLDPQAQSSHLRSVVIRPDQPHPEQAVSMASDVGTEQAAVRVESSGMMASIPAPQGTHIRFDDAEVEAQLDHQAGPQQAAHLNALQQLTARHQEAAEQHLLQQQTDHPSRDDADSLTDDSHGLCLDASLVQAAVQGLLGSTVMSSLPTQQALPLSSIVPDTPDLPPELVANSAHQPSLSKHNLGSGVVSSEQLGASSPATGVSESQATQLDPHATQLGPHAVASTTLDTTASQQADAAHRPRDRQSDLTNDAAPSRITQAVLDADEEADGGGMATEAALVSGGGNAGIMYSSLSSHLQSKLELPRNLWKYWLQRYSLFTKFDEGILMDEEGWYSATPEVLAAHHAGKCRCSVIVDAFAGVGGNAIQFALTCDRVIAVELCAQRLELAKHNAEVYGVAHKIDFICGDFLQVAATLQADMVFLSPPWGGPAYSKSGLFDVSQGIGTLQQNLRQLLHTASSALKDPDSRRIACFLPRNTDLSILGDSMPSEQQCLVERNVLNSHLKAVTVYYGSLADI